MPNHPAPKEHPTLRHRQSQQMPPLFWGQLARSVNAPTQVFGSLLRAYVNRHAVFLLGSFSSQTRLLTLYQFHFAGWWAP
jgi:hypothetical protein